VSSLQQSFVFDAPARPAAPPRRNLVIEAGAGTGKTTAIVAEVLRLLLENEELLPERIVLVTFTEKAAGEIAARIHAALAELESQFDREETVVWPPRSPASLLVIPPEQREAARRACALQLGRIDSLRSQTIHSFCQSLLRQFPLEAQLDPHFKIVQGFERSLLYGQLYDEWIDQETRRSADPAVLAEWEIALGHAGYLFFIRSIVHSFVERRDVLFDGYGIGTTDSLTDGLAAALASLHDWDSPIGRYLAETPAPDDSAPASEWIAFFEPIAQEIRQIDLNRSPRDKREILRRLRVKDKGTSIYDRLAAHRAAEAVIAMARRFIRFLDERKRTLGVVDFDDLLLRTLAVLDHPAVLERARAQYDYIFVDEFQDTDRTQARILDRLARDASGAFVPGKTIVVGDPKQSIYSFRRADPETYSRMTEALIAAGAEHRVLEDQYRSDPPLLDALNGVFTTIFPPQPAHDPNVFRPEYRPLRARREEKRRELDAHITFLAAASEGADAHLAEPQAIAEWIRAHSDGDLRRFAILMRRMTIAEQYVDTLGRYGIDVVLPPAGEFLEHPAVAGVLTVLRAIAWPFDRGAMVSAARTPYFALTDEEIVRGILQGAGGNREPWEAFTTAIDRYRELARHLTVAQLLERVIATSGIESVYAAAAGGERAMLYLDHLRSVALEYDRSTGGSVRQFIAEIDRRREDPDEVEPALIDESRNAVRMMSVHAAKGLEFDTVILPDLMFRPNSREIFTVEEPRELVFSSNTLRTINADRLGDIGSSREEAEGRRLFYVAVTRAKSEVVFVCNLEKFAKKGFMASLVELFGFEKTTFPGLFPEGRVIRELAPAGRVAFERLPAGQAGERQRRRLTDVSLEAALAGGELVPHEIPLADPLTLLPFTPRSSAAREAGILLHRILERWDGAAPLDGQLDLLGREAGAAPDVVSRVRRRLAVIARSPMLGRIARAETVGRELPLRIVDEGGIVVERRIDRLIRENGREIVVDYKSGAPAEEHREQVTRYAEAIAAMTGRPCGAILWYVDLENDRVIELP
jgi:ATP-dependent helicase/nuclease subunit A